jgi:hypothetical protein
VVELAVEADRDLAGVDPVAADAELAGVGGGAGFGLGG